MSWNVENVSIIAQWGLDKRVTIFQTMFSNACNPNVWISITISLKYVPKDPINNIISIHIGIIFKQLKIKSDSYNSSWCAISNAIMGNFG